MALVEDAVGLIDPHQAGVELGEGASHKFRCVEPFGRDQQGWSLPGIPQRLGGDEIDEALSPAGLLGDKDPAALFADGLDRLGLSIAEVGGWAFGTCSQQLQCAIVIENSARGHDPRSVSKDVSPSWGNERIETPR